ncbi:MULTISPECIES: hypothetical protein [Streptococcus]|uniref:Uncharacterized protein n=1 Tax=Streptococcus caledonicus TaxID=2614158 RepID=A0ABW0UA52_9STRE|nr:hypothetical protein [Streptococcus sp. S784/96/1]
MREKSIIIIVGLLLMVILSYLIMVQLGTMLLLPSLTPNVVLTT